MCVGTVGKLQRKEIYIEQINLLFWNIHGQHSKTVGDKLTDNDFLNKINDCHILGLVELHTDSIVNIPGFTLIKQKFRKKNHKGPKLAGGLAVFVKNELSRMINLVPNNHADSIWVKIKKEESKEHNDIFIGTTYLSPKLNDIKNSFEMFLDEISHFKE